MKKLIFIFTLCITYTLSYAQDSNSELLKKLVEKNILTQSEADSLSNSPIEKHQKNSLADNVEKVRQAFNTPYMQFGGYGLFLYKYNDMERIKHTAEPRVVFLYMQGELIENFKYYILADFVKPMPYEFWAEWTPSTKFNIRLGQMKTPISLENQLSLTALESIQNTRSISSLVGMNSDVIKLQSGKNSAGRDIGVQVYGSLLKAKTHDLIQYGIGIYQGTGINTSENNNSKDFAGNIMLQPLKGFRIGGGLYLGEATYSMNKENTPVENHTRNRWILSSDYKTDRFYARAEWINGNDGGIKKEGLHGIGLWYFIPQKLNAFAKLDYYNQNKETNSEVTDYIAGVNYYFYKSCRLQLNYIHSDYSKNWNSPNSNSILGQLQIVF